MLTTILFILTIGLSISTLILSVKRDVLAKKLNIANDKVNNFDNLLQGYYKPLRQGHYIINCTQENKEKNMIYNVECVILVNEIDRYTNGESKLEFVDVNMICDSSKFDPDSMRNFVKKSFRIYRKTDEINWLESEIEIKETRKNKLDKIKESLKSLNS